LLNLNPFGVVRVVVVAVDISVIVVDVVVTMDGAAVDHNFFFSTQLFYA